MRRTLLIAALLLPLLSCQAPGERTALPPLLPEKITPMPYGQLLERARTQVTQANHAFYVNKWIELEDAARGLEQTAQYLSKADDVPTKHKDTLATMSGDFGKLAKALREAATGLREKATETDVNKANAIMAKLQLKVREMRLAD